MLFLFAVYRCLKFRTPNIGLVLLGSLTSKHIQCPCCIEVRALYGHFVHKAHEVPEPSDPSWCSQDAIVLWVSHIDCVCSLLLVSSCSTCSALPPPSFHVTPKVRGSADQVWHGGSDLPCERPVNVAGGTWSVFEDRFFTQEQAIPSSCYWLNGSHMAGVLMCECS